MSINASGTSYVGGIVGQMSKEVDGINSCLVRGTVDDKKRWGIGGIPDTGASNPSIEFKWNNVYAQVRSSMISGKYAGGLIGIIVDNIVDDIEIKFNTIHSPLIQVDNYLGIMVGGAQYWAFSTTEFNYNFSTTEYSELSYNSIGGEIIGHSSASCTSPASSNNVVQNDQGLSSDSCVQVIY